MECVDVSLLPRRWRMGHARLRWRAQETNTCAASAYWETEAKTRRPESLLVSYRR